jgi:hypothetical protein
VHRYRIRNQVAFFAAQIRSLMLQTVLGRRIKSSPLATTAKEALIRRILFDICGISLFS